VSDVPVRVPPNIPPNIAVVGLAVIGFAASGCGEPDTRIDHLDGSDISVRAIETEIPEIMAGARLPGLQVAIIDDGRVVYTNGFGVRSTETQEPVTDRTVFAALSFSKTIFTYLVMQLADEGLMDLDRPLVSYLPKPLPKYEFYRDLEGDELHATLTARMALSHTTGLPNWRWFTPEGTLQFVFEPGERFSYSGEGIYLLQLAVEEIAGESVEELARVRIFEPLGLERTSFVFLPSFEDDYAVDHDRFLAPIGKGRREEANAAGSAQTTAEEYATFLAAVMRGEGLSAASREELSTPVGGSSSPSTDVRSSTRATTRAPQTTTSRSRTEAWRSSFWATPRPWNRPRRRSPSCSSVTDTPRTAFWDTSRTTRRGIAWWGRSLPRASRAGSSTTRP
jgi:CubicO group peptidase (beta-lactamase class C family)